MHRGQARRMSCASLVPGTSSLALAVGSDWANVVGSLLTPSRQPSRLTASAFLLQPSPAPIVRCRIAAPPRRRSAACPRRPDRRAQRLIRSAKPLIPPATFRLPRLAPPLLWLDRVSCLRARDGVFLFLFTSSLDRLPISQSAAPLNLQGGRSSLCSALDLTYVTSLGYAWALAAKSD